MSTAPDSIMDRIRKLLDKHIGNGCTEAESQTAFQMASRLMTEHNLTMEQIDSHERTDNSNWMEETIETMGRKTAPQEYAAQIVRDFFFVHASYFHHGNRRKDLRFFGKRENIDTAKFVYFSLLREFDRLWLDFKLRHYAGTKEKASFMLGLKHGFRQKLTEERKAMEAKQGTGTALAVIHNKIELAFKEAHSDMIFFKSTTPVAGNSQRAYEAGKEKGQRITLNRSVDENRQKALE